MSDMRKILVVDDEKMLRECLRDMFFQRDCVVYEASNGEEALRILSNQSVDLILTDVDMPVKNGLDFLREFRQIDRTTPVAIMSGGNVIGENTLKLIGAFSFMQKPNLDLDTLLNYIGAGLFL